MLIVRIYVFLTICLLSSNAQQQSIAIKKSSVCIGNDYVIPLFSTRIVRMTFNQTRLQQLNIHTIHLRTSIADRKIAEFQGRHHTIKTTFHLINTTSQSNDLSNMIYKMKIHGIYMSETSIHYSLVAIDINNVHHHINCSILLVISQPERLIDRIFKRAIPYIIMFTSIQMGMLLEIEVLKELARRPIQILIGFVCQYGLMPLIAFAISKIFRYESVFGLGLFVVGCCPGGTQSNQWTVVFDGDLDLSTFMSFASTVASFFMMPLWLYTLGEYAYLRQLKIRIPFGHLAISLLTIIVPLSIGMLLVYFFPKLKPLMQRIVKPMLILLIFYFFIFGAIVNFYLVYYVDLRTALTAALLPWLGFALSGTVAWLFRQDWRRMMTIGIETGIQNIGIAIMILLYSLPSPINTRSTVIPIIVAYLSPLPFYFILIYQLIRQKICQSEKQLIRRVSIDTLSKTTRQASESEPIADIPISVMDTSPDSEPLPIK